MLKFNLTQEGKTLIDALQNNDKLAITHVRLLQSGNSPSVDLPISRGAIVVDGTCNGPYAVVDVNDASANNYLASAVALLSDTKSIAELYSDEKASGYEVVLSAGVPGRTEYPSIKYRTQTWVSGKIPSRVDIQKGAGNDCDIWLSFGSKGGDPNDPSQQEVSARLTLGDNFPNTITFSNGDIWETDDTVSTTGVKTSSYSYGASSEDGETSIRPLYSKVLIQKETNKQLKLRLSCQFDGAEKCKFNTTSINLPYASRFREGVVRFTDTSNQWISDGQKYNTVYSAADVDAKIDAVTESLGNLNQYAKINAANTFAENNTFTKNITVNGEIGGDAVATTATANEKDALVVSVGFANNKYLSKTDAAGTYLKKNEAETTYLTKTDAETTYLTKSDATNTYLTKEAAEQAAGNYAKLNVENTFIGAKNTFNEVSATKFSGDGVVDAITTNATQTNQSIPTDYAVKTYVDGKTSTLNQNITDLQSKDNDLQSQIDGINAGQNLADIVNNTTELEAYDVSHLKAKGDFQHGEEGETWAIGDKVQVLGGADVQSSVYELIKGENPEANSIVSSTNGYYWRYIGVYGINAYTKAEIDDTVNTINTNIGKKADKTYVDTELGKKVDKTQIITTIDAGTATATNVTSGSAVKTYVDGKVGDINTTLGNYVTLDTEQAITGAKTFANGNITIANPNDAHKDKHYMWVRASGDNTTGDYTSSVEHWDLTHNDVASDRFMRARNSEDVFYTSDLTRFNSANNAQFNTRLNQQIGNHYQYTTSDILITTNIHDVPAAQIGTPGNKESTDKTLTENYVERIRLRKNTSIAGDADIEFLPAGQSVTDIDLFADNINNVFNNEVSFRVCTTPVEGVKTDTPVLEIRGSGVYYHTPEGNSISTAKYQLRTAGSLDFTTNMSELVGSDSHVPTTKAVADFVDNKITTGGTAFVKISAPNTNQTIDSAITVTEGITVGSNEKPATLTVSGAITGSGVATQVINTDIPDQVTTARAVANFVTNAITANQAATSNKDKVGAMGLFLYTGDQKAMGDEVAGASLQAVGMQLPMDGVVSWSQGAAMTGTWKLLNNTIAGEPCLVLAIRVG